MAIGFKSRVLDQQEDATCIEESGRKMNVFFRFVDGQTLCLWIDPSKLDISDIKQALVARKQDCSMSSSDLFLTWNGRPLDDDMFLSDYLAGRKQTATIMVSSRNRGGCFMISCSILFIIILALVSSLCTCGCSLVVIPFLLPLLFILPLFCL